ncbi:hypothetical protein EX895_000259 [Sporisorium graminicola]|uniref:pectin lyase n=1 Tax=Sporisorium graminicola TaxID=280036 RepID=A0A4U7KZD7_9BASI|nr:hypothetical protein EX895_000259 [Sporisorium graminicola]TKY90261.1 hypothetical protein EX895_000259 [Sporisorium graminicola]
MQRLLVWHFGPTLLLVTLSLLAFSSADSPGYLDYDALFPRYYRSASDELCYHNGVRFTNCEADHGKVVKLDSVSRTQLHELVEAKSFAPGSIKAVVNVMLVDLDRSLSGSEAVSVSGPDLKGAAAAMARNKSGAPSGNGVAVKQSEFDPSVAGAAAARKLHAPPVTRGEETCYLDWLKSKVYGQAEINTVLNELYVRHVAITHVSTKVYDVESPTGCYVNPADPLNRHKRSLGDEDGDGVRDDMEVYHPVLNTHLHDPWKKYRQFHQEHLLEPGEFGHRKRSMGNGWLVGGRHHVKRGEKNQKTYVPTSTFDDESTYQNGIPSAPVQQGSAGAGVAAAEGGFGGSAISSKPHGFAAGVTGGGSATPIVPKDIHELTKLLLDPQPQVIHLDKVYDFRGSEGVCTDCPVCIPDSYAKCPGKGQLAVDDGQGWCKGRPPTKVTYDKAGVTPIRVASNKSIIGISPNAAMRGKGLRIAHHQNIILHNFRIDEINPSTIWGGDGVILYDTDLVWIDKLTFSHIGRQFIVTGYLPAGRVTISNCFFDCKTKWSATCDDSHYWTVLGYGKSDRVTFSCNLMQHCSGRSPRIANPDNEAGDSVWHVVNSVFDGNTGHSLDMGPGISALIEGNVFTDVAQTSLHESSPGRAFAPSDKGVCSQCKGPLGRDCQPNAYRNAQPVPSTTSAAQVLKDVAGETLGEALPPGQVVAKVGKTAGCGAGKRDGGLKASMCARKKRE